MSRQSDEDIRKIRSELEAARREREAETNAQSNEAIAGAIKYFVIFIVLILYAIAKPIRGMFSPRINRILDITGISLLLIGSAMIYVLWSLSNYPINYPHNMFYSLYQSSVFWHRYETTYGGYGVYILIVGILLCITSPHHSDLMKRLAEG
ncbi:MAG: hypothetical protein NTX42_09645 [Methanothrix sp.]|nr:hypothetical protein [Methanothrix sp.]